MNKKPLSSLLFPVAAGLALHFLTALLPLPDGAGQALAAEDAHPSIAAGVPFFYYQDLPTAVDWYKNKLGLKAFIEEDWVVLIELTPTSYIGLVNASDGFLRPTADKGALLAIETAELDAWWDKLKDVEGIDMVHGIETGAGGMIELFRMNDPEGYIVEFFSWSKHHQPEARRYQK